MRYLQVRRASLAVVATCSLALAGVGCDVSIGENGFSLDVASGKATDEWNRSYTIVPGGRLQIENTNGRIEALPAAGSQVEIRAERIAKASTDEAARELLKQSELHEDVSAAQIRIQTKMPRQRFSRQSLEVRYHVRVPKGLSVDFETVNGGVRLENLEGQIAASTTNGGVTGTGLSGTVKATTTNGGVEIEMAAVTGDLELETTNGGIRLQLPGSIKANLDARCVNGGISVSGFDVQGEQSRRRVSGTINGGGPRISAETTNGGIRISTMARGQTH
jgi:DUF4097 and DUF4098 domain-containing protein YvlB